MAKPKSLSTGCPKIGRLRPANSSASYQANSASKVRDDVFCIRRYESREPGPKFAVGISNEDYETSLELHKIYRVLPDADAAVDGDIRVIDESGEDYLYPADWFVFIELPRSLERSLLRAA